MTLPADRVDRIAAALEKDPPEGFRGRYSREVWAVIVAAVKAAERGLCDTRVEGVDGGWAGYRAVCSCGWEGVHRRRGRITYGAAKIAARRDAVEHEAAPRGERQVCAGCGNIDPRHWREDGWYCEGCAACEVCQSPYCDEPEHA